MSAERNESPPDLVMIHRFMEAVTVLHERGHHRVHWLSGMSPSGMHVRMMIGRDTEVGNSLRDVRDLDRVITTSSGAWNGRGWSFGREIITPQWSTELIADTLLAAIPAVAAHADDPDYAAWFRGLHQICVCEGSVPIAFADDGADRSAHWEIGWGSSVTYPAPPRATRAL